MRKPSLRIVIAADMRFCFPTKIVLSVNFKIGNFKPIMVMGFPYSWVNTRCANNGRTYTIYLMILSRSFSDHHLRYTIIVADR